jgi:tripartite-type tricarboxylate transporter receptor subunit TctC
MFTRRDFLAMGATGLASFAPAPWQTARSQAIRNSARMLVGFSAGGSVDFVARLLVNEMRTYAPSFIVENRPGATGRIAMDALKNSPADGSAMILTPASIITLFPYIYKSLNYDAFHDVIPVASVCSFPYLFSIGPMVPGDVKTLADFIGWCRANPSKATFGTPGPGSPLHFTGLMLARMAQFEFTHVPYQGGPPAVQNLLGGQIAATILPVDNTLAYVKSGNLRALVTTGPQRTALLADVPTIKEAGFAALEATEWFGVFVPAKTPEEAVDHLNVTIREALTKAEVKAGLAKLAYEIADTSRSDFDGMIKSDFERWGPIVRATGFAPEN